MRTLAFIGLAAVAFLATILIAMGMTGNLSKANIARIFKGPEPVVEQAEPVDEAGPLAKALSVRDEELRKRELELEAREQRVATREEELQELRDEIAALQQQVQQSLDGEDTDREKRMADVAKSLSEMKPENAATTLQDWPPEDAAAALRIVPERERGKILDKMEPGKAALILRALQERKF